MPARGGAATVRAAMPVAVHICPDHMSRDDYKRAIEDLEKAGVHEPEGRLYHAAYGADDDVQMFEVWRSQNDFDAHSDKLFATLQGAGVNVDRVDVHPVHSEHPD
jgi:quinol monooxygenase YgiN